MKRHILNVFCGIVCTAVLWCLLSCSNGNEVNSVSGYYVAKYPNSNGQETIDYIADFKSVPGKVATFDADNGKPTKKLMDYVPYTVSGDAITFQNVKKFEPEYSSSGEGKTVRGQYDSSTNTLYYMHQQSFFLYPHILPTLYQDTLQNQALFHTAYIIDK